MGRKILIFIFAIAALVFARDEVSHEDSSATNQIIEILSQDQLIDASSNSSDYALPRQNTFSTTARNLQSGNRTSNNSLASIYFTRKGGNPTLYHSFRSFVTSLTFNPSTSNPDRMVIQLRKLVI